MKKKLIILISSILIGLTSSSASVADLVVYAPKLDNVVINSDSMQAVLYWRPSHSASDNPVVEYAATYDGINFFTLTNSYQNSYQSTISLPYRANATSYIFAIQAITMKGTGPVSNRVKKDINPYVIPIQISDLKTGLGRFSFKIKDISEVGWNPNEVQFFITDIESSTAVSATLGKSSFDQVDVMGLKPGEIISVTVFKKIINCRGFQVISVCPYSSGTVVTAQAKSSIPTPEFSSISESDGLVTVDVSNFDPDVDYRVESLSGLDATIDINGHIEVIDAPKGIEVPIRVIASHPGYPEQSSNISVKRSGTEDLPVIESVVSNKVGFNVLFSQLEANDEVSVKSTAGNAVVFNDELIKVTGLRPGQSAELLITVTRAGRVVLDTQVVSKPRILNKTRNSSSPVKK